MPDISLGLLTIATNGYTRYLPDLFQSTAIHLEDIPNYCHYVFTDDATYVLDLAKTFPSAKFEVIQIPSHRWPDATLLRYEIYSRNKTLFAHDILMHIDADMYFLSKFEFEVPPLEWVGGMAFVEHPGFYKPKFFDFRRRALKSRLRSFIIGGYGAWETSKQSTAFTPRRQRTSYLCGGAWFGFRQQFIDFCEAASRDVEIDKKNGVVAKWHDESHLNSLVARESVTTKFSSRYCYDPQFGKFLNNPILLAVDKSRSLMDQLELIDGINS